jgi:hypothetical protein
MPMMKCMQCSQLVERYQLPHHIRDHFYARNVQSLHTRNPRARDGPYRPAASPPSSTGNLTSAPSESSNSLSTESDLTLSTESDLTLSTVSTSRFSIWQQYNSVRPPAPTTIDDTALSRNNRTDSPQTSTQHLRNSVRFQVQDLVDKFEGLDAAARQACVKGMRTMPIFPVSVIFVMNLVRGGLTASTDSHCTRMCLRTLIFVPQTS